jgi:hypothetical protein
VHPNIFRGKSAKIEAIGKNFKKVSRGVLRFKTRDDIRFIKCAAIKTASPHKYFGTLEKKVRL